MVVFALLFPGCQAKDVVEENTPGESVSEETEGATAMILATTTSTYDSGLLHDLLPDFETQHNIEVNVISLGTGQAIETGKRGDCDIILIHARHLEDQFVDKGHGTERWDVMYNDFIILGPKGDPGNIYDSTNIREALDNMIEHMEEDGINFLSRGDSSGTHNKEINLWDLAGIDDFKGQEWYNSLGQGMGDTLITANEMRGYTLADRGTYLPMKDNLSNLEIVFEEDEELFNPYGIIPVNPNKHGRIKHEEAMLLVEFFTSSATQERIGEFGKDIYGQPLFFPVAK